MQLWEVSNCDLELTFVSVRVYLRESMHNVLLVRRENSCWESSLAPEEVDVDILPP